LFIQKKPYQSDFEKQASQRCARQAGAIWPADLMDAATLLFHGESAD
jgi:hypothetical protein